MLEASIQRQRNLRARLPLAGALPVSVVRHIDHALQHVATQALALHLALQLLLLFQRVLAVLRCERSEVSFLRLTFTLCCTSRIACSLRACTLLANHTVPTAAASSPLTAPMATPCFCIAAELFSSLLKAVSTCTGSISRWIEVKRECLLDNLEKAREHKHRLELVRLRAPARLQAFLLYSLTISINSMFRLELLPSSIVSRGRSIPIAMGPKPGDHRALLLRPQFLAIHVLRTSPHRGLA